MNVAVAIVTVLVRNAVPCSRTYAGVGRKSKVVRREGIG